MASRTSPRIVTLLGLGALLAGAVAPLQAQAQAQRHEPQRYERPGADVRDNTRSLTERRAQDAARQSQAAEERARAGEGRERALRQRQEQNLRGVR